MDATYNLTELSALSGVPSRKIRFYIDEGLVPKPVGKGRKTRYGEVHLATLQVITALRKERLPLDVIREYLDGYNPANVRASDPARPAVERESEPDAAANAEAPPSEDGEASSGPFHGLKGKQLAAAVVAFVAEKRASAATAFHKAAHRGDIQDESSRAGDQEPAARAADLSTWRRLSVSPDVELHVTTSYLAHLADSRKVFHVGPLTGDEALQIVLDALAATGESGAPRKSSADTGQTGGAAQGGHNGVETKTLVRSALVEAAAERRTMRYADVARIMDITPSGQFMGMRVGSLLDEICEDEVRHGRPMLSALVVGYTGRPGKGFFATAQALGRLKEGDDEAAFFARELEAVYETWQRPSSDG